MLMGILRVVMRAEEEEEGCMVDRCIDKGVHTAVGAAAAAAESV